MKLSLLRHISTGNAALYLLGAAVAVALKYHYSTASADDLFWILYPTTILVELVTGRHFERESCSGFVDYNHGIVIAPACGGVNFLVIAFCTILFPLAHKIRSLKDRWLWFGIALVSSYLQTIAVNSMRIVFSILLLENNVHYGWLTPERVHRLEGVVVYFFFLSIFYLLMKKAAICICVAETESRGSHNPTAFAPLFWYFLIALGVPILRGSNQEPGGRFVEHLWTVGPACVFIFFVIHLFSLYSRRIMYNIEGVIKRLSKTGKGV